MIAKDIHYIGVNDHRIDLFESQYTVPNGVSYNSYVITDGKIAVMDTVDAAFTHEWLDNLETVLKGRKPDYLVIQHMEPDHSANIAARILCRNLWMERRSMRWLMCLCWPKLIRL